MTHMNSWPRSWMRVSAGALGALLLTGACTGGGPGAGASTPEVNGGAGAIEATPDAGGNLLRNPGFEAGRDGWFDLSGERGYWHGFEVVETDAAEGRRAARLVLEAPPRADPVAIHGVVQDLVPPGRALPETLALAYRIGSWRRGTPKQYVQVVVIAEDRSPMAPNQEIRYVLAGIDRAPFSMAAAKFLFLGPLEPEPGRWVRVERDLRRDWVERWGRLPARCDSIRVLLEVRYDDRAGAEPGALAEVFYDDVRLGTRR